MHLIITGASKGIGLELLKFGLKNKHNVLAVVRHPELSEELKELEKKYHNLQILNLDLNQENAHVIIANAVKDWPCVDVIINNAGVYLDDDTLSDFEKSYLINTLKPYFITKSLLPALKKSKRPVALQITSQMGSIADNTSGGSHSYRASKAALNMIFKGLSIEEKWLIVYLIHPGWVQTRMGGTNAPVKVEESASGIWNILESAKLSDSGIFKNYLGEKLPW